MRPQPRLPRPYQVGQRIVTNERYAACNARNPGPRMGTIVAGSSGADGPVMVKLDDHRYAHAMTSNLFDVVKP